MEHIVKFEKGYDCIRFECKWKKNNCKPFKGGSHGRHGLGIRFLVKGDKGVVQFLLNTGWVPQKKEKDSIGTRMIDSYSGGKDYTMPADLGYHSRFPMYEGQAEMSGSCEYLDGAKCYYDGSGLRAYDAMYALVNGGDKALWEFLDAEYMAIFEGGKSIEPEEYEMKER